MMRTQERLAGLSLVLALFALVLGAWVPGILFADYGHPMALRFFLSGMPFVFIPFAIGWLAPALWWLAGAGAFIPMLFLLIALLTSLPATPGELLARWPVVLPLLLTLSFARLGKYFRQRSRR